MAQEIVLAEYLTLDGFSLSTPAWTHLDLSQLFDGPDMRGDNRLIPGAPWVVSFPERPTVSERQLPMVFYGDMNDEGTPYADQRVGLETNLAAFKAAVLAPSSDADGCRAGVLHIASGATLTARVKVRSPMSLGAVGPFAMRAVLNLQLPLGVFV